MDLEEPHSYEKQLLFHIKMRFVDKDENLLEPRAKLSLSSSLISSTSILALFFPLEEVGKELNLIDL